ncbi:MAG: N-acetylmuramoyl-L-alanine amidase [Deltaproteobacteria bacterium]|jgi:N-acetylmuramoyl-L-alanine amidase|nr:N-acetylmuramoyl-L-alanine amidase [Deltaproteobacteria bacterium]MBW2504450.1 N-acetylmuramoyl-L-alanine amidase [Deltaproteobacteria bacterium]
MTRFCFSSIFIIGLVFFCGNNSLALVEIGVLGQDPVIIEDVYQREGTSFVSIDEVLTALNLEGDWDSVKHIYRLRTPHGWAIISPGSQFLRLGDNLMPVAHRPRFIDGKLRVSETFILRQLSPLVSNQIYYRNHDPVAKAETEDPLDRLFAFLLQKKDDIRPQNKRIVVIDPGHGGQDPGVLGPEGVKEKSLTLTVAHRLEKLLKMHQDAPVVLTRNDDYTIDLPKRLEIVAESGADVMLSLHAQMYFRTDPQGVMLFVQSQANWTDPGVAFDEDTSLVLAEALKRSLQAGGFNVHPVQELPVLPLGQGNLPRVMIEMGNLGNALDLSMLQDDTRQQDFARALFDGLNQFLTASQGDR